MHKHFKLSHHRHSGRHRPHEHTSYLPLFILLFITGVTLVSGTVSAQTSPGPDSRSVSLTGAVSGPAPSTAATITSPTPGQSFGESPITVSGNCPPKTLVEILKNNIFGGSTICTADGTFELQVDLLLGSNDLIARVYNALNQPGPNSAIVTVSYNGLPPQAAALDPLNFNRNQLLINTDSVYRGTFANEKLVMPIEIIGGTPPYAVEVKWGDNEKSIIPRSNNQPFTATHIYTRPGTYKVILQATDSAERVAFLMVVVIINGQPPESADTTADDQASTIAAVSRQLAVMWPLYAMASTAVVSFWLGEKREKELLTGVPTQSKLFNHQKHGSKHQKKQRHDDYGERPEPNNQDDHS